MWLGSKRGYLQDWITQIWVKTTGRKIDPGKHKWLVGPAGDTQKINDTYIQTLCDAEGLELKRNQPGFGLLNQPEDFGLAEGELNRLHPKILDFYTRTYDYGFEVWSKWGSVFYPFGWLLSRVFSKRLQQLNLPLNPIDAAKGFESHIIKLYNKALQVNYTIWYRILKARNSVVFSGIYGTTFVENENKTCLKIVFPLPNGNATVILSIKVNADGTLRLTSKGRSFGDPGFYFMLAENGRHWARYVKSMHETLDVYINDEGTLHAEHVFKFYGLTFMTLHYKMVEKQ